MPVKKQPPLPSDWAVIELPSTDAELLKQTRQPEQVSELPVADSGPPKYSYKGNQSR